MLKKDAFRKTQFTRFHYAAVRRMLDLILIVGIIFSSVIQTANAQGFGQSIKWYDWLCIAQEIPAVGRFCWSQVTIASDGALSNYSRFNTPSSYSATPSSLVFPTIRASHFPYMTVGQEVKKFTWLLDNVEVKGIVRANLLPDGAEVGTGDSFDIEPDENYRHLISYVPGSGQWVHCETYPLDPSSINRAEPWSLPKKIEQAPFVVRDPATGWQVPLKVGDHVRVVGRWVIDHHPENCVTRTRGRLKVGCAHVEFHPFRWDDIRLVKDVNPWEFEEEIVSVAAPLHEEIYLRDWKWVANELAGVASKIFITEDGSNYHNTVTANAYIKAPKLPAGFTPHRTLIGFQEEVPTNGTGQDVSQVRSLEVIDNGLKVTTTLNAPRTLQFDNLMVADVNDPANLKSIFQARYRVWWQPRLVFIDLQGGSLGRLDLPPQDVGATYSFEVFVKNRGPDLLQITGVSLIDDPYHVFQIDPVNTTTLSSGMALDLHGTFTPTSARSFDGTIVVTSNDPAHRSISIHITGGVTPPSSLSLRVSVQPYPNQYNIATSVVVSAQDARTKARVSGTVWINGVQVGVTDTPFTYTFHLERRRVRDPRDGRWTWEFIPPVGLVKAQGYPNAPIDFGFPE